MNPLNTDVKILVINCGSSSIKYEVYSMPEKISLGKGLVERIGEKKAHIIQNTKKGDLSKNHHLNLL